MASKILTLFLVVTICKVQSQSISCFPNTQASSPGQTNVQTNIPSSQCIGQPSQPQTISSQNTNYNKGIIASPQLQIGPGQGYNLQAIPVSQLIGSNQVLGQFQNPGCNSPRPAIQSNPIPQVQSSPAIQPSLCGPSSVITSPVSTMTIPPSRDSTIIDYSLCNSLANALQLLIANDFINSAISNNIISPDCVQIPLVDTVLPGIDLSALLQSLDANQQSQVSPTPIQNQASFSNQIGGLRQSGQSIQVDQPQPTYDWSSIQNFLNQQDQQSTVKTNPQPQCISADLSNLINYVKQNGRTVDQITNKQTPSSSQVQCKQPAVNVKSDDLSNSGIIEALAAYLGCDNSEVSSYCYPSFGDIVFPEEIPAQLVCNYGYMPTTVPVVSFSVQPVTNGDCNGNFPIGGQC